MWETTLWPGRVVGANSGTWVRGGGVPCRLQNRQSVGSQKSKPGAKEIGVRAGCAPLILR